MQLQVTFYMTYQIIQKCNGMKKHVDPDKTQIQMAGIFFKHK